MHFIDLFRVKEEVAATGSDNTQAVGKDLREIYLLLQSLNELTHKVLSALSQILPSIIHFQNEKMAICMNFPTWDGKIAHSRTGTETQSKPSTAQRGLREAVSGLR